MTKKQSQALIGLVILVIIVAVVYYVMDNKKANETASNSPTPTEQTPTTTPSPTPVTPSTKAYTDAVAIYGKSGFRLQFAQSCLATPTSIVIKKGAKFMIDNRENVKHTFKVKSQTFNLAAYGYVIVTATELGQYSVTCDGNPRVSLNVEK